MADYTCRSGGHSFPEGEVSPGPDGQLRCPEDYSPLEANSAGKTGSDSSRPRLRPVRLLRISFDGGQVEVRPGERVLLGRDDEYSPHAELFVPHAGVSRRHATVGLEPDGRAWIRDEYASNQTKVNGDPLVPGGEQDLADENMIRLCVDTSGKVTLIRGDDDAR